MNDGPKVEDRRNQLFVNEKNHSFQVIIFDEGQDAVVKCLGSLEVAKDLVKQKIAEWRMQEAERRGILVPQPNGKAGLHVQ